MFHEIGNKLKISDTLFGKSDDGCEVRLFKMTCPNGFSIAITNYGATLTSIKMPCRTGELAEIIAGFPELAGYMAPHPYFGATVGRFANRISEAKFTLDGIV